MKTLVMLINQLRNSGPNRVMLDIAANVDRTKVRPVVISLRKDDTVRPIARQFEQIGVEIHRFDYNFYSLELLTSRIAKRLEAFISASFENPVVQAHGYHPTLITARMKLPHTVTIHCISKEDFVKSRGPVLGRYMVWRFSKNLKEQKYPVAISSYMMDFYRKICSYPIRLIYNGVSFSPHAVNISRLKENLNIPSDKKVIIVTGGLYERKNNTHTIRQLKNSGVKDFLCIFLGIGPQESLLRDEVGFDSRFRFEGYHTNIAEYLAVADLYISSSLTEGLPLAVLEAECSGVPALLSDIPPHREIVERVNTPGVSTFNLGNNELSETLHNYLLGFWNRETISKNALKYFSSKQMGANYTDLIEEIK